MVLNCFYYTAISAIAVVPFDGSGAYISAPQIMNVFTRKIVHKPVTLSIRIMFNCLYHIFSNKNVSRKFARGTTKKTLIPRNFYGLRNTFL